MSEFLTFVERIKDLGSTVLIVGAAIWFGFKYLPDQMRRQGEITEVVRNNSVVIENCTEVLRMVSTRDSEIQETLERLEKRVNETNLDVHDLKHNQHFIERMNDE